MHFNRLLLGSAAAFLAVGTARAADAVTISEPESMEYVRICETYGVGFYYIPGTETCLKVSGYIRYDVGAEAFGLTDVIDKKAQAEGDFGWWDDLNDTYDQRARFQLRLDSRAETELGTLRTYAAINFDYDTLVSENYFDDRLTGTGSHISIEHAYLQLGGFRAGVTDSLFTTFTGYGGGVINDDIISYGPNRTHQMAYGWESDSGFAAAIALEMGGGDLIAPFLAPDFDEPDLYAQWDSYVPHVVAGFGWQGAWGGASLVAGYDSVWDEGAIKARVDFYPTDRLALFAMAGWSTYDQDYLDLYYWNFQGGMWSLVSVEVKDSPNYFAPWGGNWAVWGGGSFMLTDKATFNVQASYDQMQDFAIVANVAYEVAPNFVVTPEIAYIDNFNDEFQRWNEDWRGENVPAKNWGLFVRAQANFGG